MQNQLNLLVWMTFRLFNYLAKPLFIAKVGYKLEKEKFRQHSPEIINSNYLLQGQYFEFQICSNLFSSHQGTKIKVKTSTASGLQVTDAKGNPPEVHSKSRPVYTTD